MLSWLMTSACSLQHSASSVVMKTSCCWLLLLLLVYGCNGATNKPCIPRDFNKGGTVCVCNTTYCDTVEPATKVDPGQFIVFSSSMSGLRFQKFIGNFTNISSAAPITGVKYSINVNKTYQTVFGFGTAFTDAAGINLLNLNQELQENLLRSYFSPEGIELNFARLPIGGTDFSTHTYTYDDGDEDPTLENFHLAPEDFKYKIPLLKRAQAMSERPIKLLASAWTPPPWMKTNKDYSGYGFLEEKYFQTWADYHIKFLDAYKEEGLKMWAMTTGNEPMNGIIPIKWFNSLGWTPHSHRTWIGQHLGPTLRASQHNATKLLALDDQRFLLPWWLQLVFADEAAKSYIDGIAVHWYWDSVYPASSLDSTHNKYPDKFILGTEACVGDKPWELEKVILGSWHRGEMYITDIIQDLNHWVTGWLDWNYALNMQGGPTWADNFVDAPVIVNEKDQEFYKQPMFYALGHFSKFITDGSKRVQLVKVRNPIGLEIVALMRPDQAVVIVIFNGKNIDVPLVLNDPRRGNIKLRVKKHSIHTVLYW